MRPKVGFVIQRYGEEVNGGAEQLTRQLAEHLIKYWDIDVLTTCATDHVTWKDDYKPGKYIINDVNVLRFKVKKIRKRASFSRLEHRMWTKQSQGEEITPKEQNKWIHSLGPYTEQLVKYIKENHHKYDAFIFFTYMYYQTFFGLPFAKDKAILEPLAHDEPPIYLSMWDKLFHEPRGLIFNTIEESDFVRNKFKCDYIPSEIIGIGTTVPSKLELEKFKEKYKLNNCKYITFIGRIEEAKGSKDLFAHFIQFKKDNPNYNLKLVLMGKSIVFIPFHKDIIHLGFIPEQEKFSGLSGAAALINPSQYESLSMVLLESWSVKVPVIVNGKCEVLKGQVERSKGGYSYENYQDYETVLKRILDNEDQANVLGNNGFDFVQKNYSWDIVVKKYLDFVNKTLLLKEND